MYLPRVCFIFCAVVLVLCFCNEPGGKKQLAQRIYKLLDKICCTRNQLNGSTKFSLLFSEFLIKQKLRYMESMKFNRQIYNHLLHRINILKNSSQFQSFNEMQNQILANVFQNHAIFLLPSLHYGLLNSNADYKQLAMDYENVLNKGSPNKTQSDFCMKNIVTLRFPNCQLDSKCLEILTSKAPTYGYHRTHQVLLLYILQHHECSIYFTTTQIYNLLAKHYCNNVDREQNAIRSLRLPQQYHDLYLEQATICGLYGYNEFINWRNVKEVNSWFDENRYRHDDDKIDNYHLNDLALVFYINALLLLN